MVKLLTRSRCPECKSYKVERRVKKGICNECGASGPWEYFSDRVARQIARRSFDKIKGRNLFDPRY